MAHRDSLLIPMTSRTLLTRRAVRLAEAEAVVAPSSTTFASAATALLDYAREFDGFDGTDSVRVPEECERAKTAAPATFSRAVATAAATSATMRRADSAELEDCGRRPQTRPHRATARLAWPRISRRAVIPCPPPC